MTAINEENTVSSIIPAKNNDAGENSEQVNDQGNEMSLDTTTTVNVEEFEEKQIPETGKRLENTGPGVESKVEVGGNEFSRVSSQLNLFLKCF